ncbi:hypothetical protein CB1_098824002 [Camelus ferus]|nr:hypothetical protein CB1_098824002 [Camelus ferus]
MSSVDAHARVSSRHTVFSTNSTTFTHCPAPRLPHLLPGSFHITISTYRLAWAKNTQDPQIAVGSQSPLEKKIKGLGGVHSSEARKLLAQKIQQENETLHKLKAMSSDFRFAQAEAYFYHHHQQMMLEEVRTHKVTPKWEVKEEEEEKRPSEKTEDAKKRCFPVPEKELRQIEKHIHRAKQARGLRDHEFRPLPLRIPSEMLFPKALTLEKNENTESIQKIHKTKTKEHRLAWAEKQIKGHQDRMTRGRELTEQRNHQRDAQKLSAQAPPFLKPQVEKEKVKELEWVTAYPLVQPYQDSLIEVTVLMEKSNKEDKIKKPLQREFLRMPPFLRRQLEKHKI